MATKIAEYKFGDYDTYKSAVDRICKEGGSNDSWTCDYPYIKIYDNCDYSVLAGKICRAYGGKSI